jgi:sigma-E factor negative regulatory protein RseA
MQEISQLMDGEFEDDEAVRELGRVKADASRREAWDTYHLIGDAMRATVRDPVRLMQPGFQERFSAKLAAEPTVLAPRAQPVKSHVTAWALPIAASVAAVAVVGWMSFSALKPDAGNAVVAGPAQPAPARAVAAEPAAVAEAVTAPSAVVSVVAERGHMHEYLLAHQGISPSTAIQGVTPYIRTVSATGD